MNGLFERGGSQHSSSMSSLVDVDLIGYCFEQEEKIRLGLQ